MKSQDILKLLNYSLQIILNAGVGYFFLRILAYYFGATTTKDCFDLTYAIPFIILRLCGFTLIHGAAVNHLTHLKNSKTPDEFSNTFSELLSTIILLVVALICIILIFCQPIVTLVAPGLDAQSHKTVISLLFLMLPLAVWFCIGTLLSAVLITSQIHLSSELPQICSRSFTIASMIYLGGNFDVFAVAILLNLGALLGICIQWVLTFRNTNLYFRPRLSNRDSAATVILQSLPSLFNLAILAQISFLMMQRYASLNGPGSIAMLTYTLGIAAPLSLIIGKPLSLCYGPTLTKLIADKSYVTAEKMIWRLITVVLLITIPFGIVFDRNAQLFIYLLLAGGAFDEAAIDQTAYLAQYAVWGIPAAVICWVTQPALLTLPSWKYRFLILCGGYLLQIIFLLTSNNRYGLLGLIISYLIGIYTQSMLSTYSLISNVRHQKN